MDLQEITLKNKLKLLLINSPGQKIATSQIWFRTGSALERPSHFGIAHFLEHMLFKGTSKRPNGKIALDVESFGGEINAFTSFNYTCYYINSPKKCLTQALDILFDMVTSPSFLEKEIIPEREVVLEEYKRSIDSPGQFLFKELQEQAFPKGHKHPILGTEKTITRFSKEQLTYFFQKYYSTENALLVIGADLQKDKNQIIKKIESFKIKKGIKTKFDDFQINPKGSFSIHEKDTQQMQMLLSYQGPQYNSLNSVMEDLAVSTLGHGESSRFYKNLITKKSLATSCNFSTMYFEKGSTHLLRISFPPQKTKSVLNEIFHLMKQSTQLNFSEQEVDRIKNLYISSKIYEKESLEAYAFSMGYNFALTGDIHAENKFIDQMKQIGADKIAPTINEIFSRPCQMAVQTPTGKSATYQKDFKKFYNMISPLNNERKKAVEKKKKTIPFAQSQYDDQTKLFILKNGIKFLYRYNPLTPTFVFHSYINGGLAKENFQNNGSHSLISSLLTRGHKKLTDEKIQNILDECSANLSGISGKNSYGLTLHGKEEDFNKLTDQFFLSLLYPTFGQKELTHEKEMILRYFKNQEKDPTKQCFKKFAEIIYKDHHYALDANGNSISIPKISRNYLKSLHQKNLKENPIIFSYCGPHQEAQVLNLVENQIECLGARKSSILSKKNQLKVNKSIREFISFEREQTQIFLGTSGLSMENANAHLLKIITAFLSGQSSPLFTKMRDELGLCYTVQPINFIGMDGGHFGIYMASGSEKAKDSFSYLENFIKDLGKKGLNKAQFKMAKKIIEGSTLLGLVTNDDYASTYSIPELNNLSFDYIYQTNKKIENTSLEEFNNFLFNFFNRTWHAVVVGKETIF